MLYYKEDIFILAVYVKSAKRVEITFPMFYNQEVADSKSRLEISPVL